MYKTIDIAHPPLSSDAAEQILDDEIRTIRNSSEFRVLKIVHGYGSTTGKGILKEAVKNWLYRSRKRILAVIPGEEYDMQDAKTMQMRKECGQFADPDLGAGNQGITIIWIK